MKLRSAGVIGVLAIAASIVVYKTKSSSTGSAGRVASVSSKASRPTVVLIADMREAEDPCVCGQIIRSVRSAAARGIPTTEIDPAESPQLASTYNARVAPAVLLFDASGNEMRRFEGESAETMVALQAALEQLSPKSP
ncbi:MAG TPA: hypothetical protein VGF45_07430 [Polyangia bacterium]